LVSQTGRPIKETHVAWMSQALKNRPGSCLILSKRESDPALLILCNDGWVRFPATNKVLTHMEEEHPKPGRPQTESQCYNLRSKSKGLMRSSGEAKCASSLVRHSPQACHLMIQSACRY
jgi:hypothetical protein